MEKRYLTPALVDLFQGSPNLFTRCDHNGKEKPDGECWRVRVDGGVGFQGLSENLN